MTLDLTPEQRADLLEAVETKFADAKETLHRASFGTTAAFAQAHTHAARIQSLHDLLAKSTTVILHQP